MMDFASYEKQLYADVFEKLSIIRPEINRRQYYEGHKPRFKAQVQMFYDLNANINLVYDLGTDVPFASYYLCLTRGATVIFGCNNREPIEIKKNVTSIKINLNKPLELPAADMVICTECLEHLPSNLYAVRAYLMSLVRRGGFLLLSFPLGGKNASNYEKENLGDHDTEYEPHFREFTYETSKDFVKTIGFKIVSEEKTYTTEYGGDILNVLMQREW